MIVVQTGIANAPAKFIIDKFEKLKVDRGTWETHWKELSKYVIPLKDNIYGGEIKGEKKGSELFDAIGIRCNEQLASALHGMLTNPATQWFGFSSGDHLIDSKQTVAKWIQDTAKKVLFVLNNSNFQSEIHETFIDLGGFGTNNLIVEEDAIEVVRFNSRPIYEVVVSENYTGIIDTVYYEYKMTIEQLAERFPDTLPPDIMKLREQSPLQELYIVHAVEPTSRLPKQLQHEMLPFTSLHILKDNAVVLKKAGFEENPCIVSRFSKLSGEMFGRSPAMKALPDIKTCNQMMKAWLEGAQLAVNPPMQAPDEGVLLPVRLTPGGMNYYRADSKDRIEPIFTGANPQIGNQIIEFLHSSVKSAFYIDQLHLVENDRMTATEVMQRRDEQLRSMSPILGRLQYELLAPIVLRVFGIMLRRGMIDPIPNELRNAKLEVKFISQIARAQESIEGDNFLRAFQASAGVAELDPTSMDVVNTDEVVKFLFKTYGSPLHLLRKEQEVKQIRESRAQQQQAATSSEMANIDSQTAKNMAQAQQLQG